MNTPMIAEEVLQAIGGAKNVSACDICMTRLRILSNNPALVDTDELCSISGVLGVVQRGTCGLEIVFSPGKVEAVQRQIVMRTGVRPMTDIFEGLSVDPAGPLKVQISAAGAATAKAATPAPARPADPTLAPRNSDEINELASLLDGIHDIDEEGPAAVAETEPAVEPEAEDEADHRVLVINGPNINMLGIREPAIYGREDYQSLLALCHDAAREAGFAGCTILQSNHEGDLVDFIQDALGTCDGIVINPGAYTHTSVAILDAVKAVSLPCIEVHISEVSEREEFRQVSYIRQACFETITGMGIEGYRKAILDMAAHLGI